MLGSNFDDSVVNAISLGETSRTEIKALLGEPYRTGQVNDDLVWIYLYEEYEFPAQTDIRVQVNTYQKSLIIHFDENDRVKSFTQNMPFSHNVGQAMMFHQENLKQQNQDEVTPHRY